MDHDEERALARREPAMPVLADPYERQYMKGDGRVLYRDKQRSPWQMAALFATAAVISVLPVVGGLPGALLTAGFTVPFLFLLWVLMGVLRVTVSEGMVDVQYGVFGPKIPIAAIEAVAPIEYRWTTMGGWGIRRGPAGSWVYNMPGDGGRAVRIEWRDAKGRRRVTIVGSRNHHDLFRAIESARQALSGGALPDAAVSSRARLGPGDADHEQG